ncbi:hypothetical protein BDQ17DRAFT_1338185 [Cyathus striatus]|nr:hypothetical protein BDQ17DRAFT_1338185 [Cyathus striatus]
MPGKTNRDDAPTYAKATESPGASAADNHISPLAPISSSTVNQQAKSSSHSTKDIRVEYKATAFCNTENATVEYTTAPDQAIMLKTLRKMLKDGDITKDDYVDMYGRLLRHDKETISAINAAIGNDGRGSDVSC